jgi:aryl-alcohol dehydrogenase-like predicted oxidoreductase
MLLRTDRLDLMQLHNVCDPHQDLAMLRDWKSQGICRYIGITTSFGGDFAAVEAVLRREKPDFVQVNYSLADRAAERRVIPTAAEVGAAVVTDLPFARNRLFRAVRGGLCRNGPRSSTRQAGRSSSSSIFSATRQ